MYKNRILATLLTFATLSTSAQAPGKPEIISGATTASLGLLAISAAPFTSRAPLKENTFFWGGLIGLSTGLIVLSIGLDDLHTHKHPATAPQTRLNIKPLGFALLF